MLKPCPNPVDVQDIQFKLRCRLNVFDNKDLKTFSTPHSLISCASRYGLLFVGSNSHILQAILLKSIETYSLKDKDISTYPRRTLNLPSPPKHVCVNCDSTILAIVVEKDKCPTVIFYDVLSFYKQNIAIIKELRLSATPAVTVTEAAWNPALPLIFTASKSDGTLGVYEIKGSMVDINELPAAAQTSSFCWSPKGKQIAVGSKNGKITQYKPDLKAVKVINEPPLHRPHSLISLQWVSNYQFVGIYQSEGAEGQAKLIVVDAPKTGETGYIDYDDVCYSGSSTTPQFYMILLQHWNVLMVASSNSTEVGVLGTSAPDTWTQWIISDSARAELPLSPDKQETLPVGLALDISPTKPLPWGEATIPPCPYLLILSHQGVLCVFDVVNLKPGSPNICSPPDNIADTSGLAQFVNEGEVRGQPPPAFATGATQSAKTTPTPPALFKPLPTYSSQPPTQPPSTTSAITSSGSLPLFGGQTTLTPVKPPQQVAPKQPLFGGQTSLTPVKPQQQVAPKQPLFGGQTSLTPVQPKPAVASSAPPFSVQTVTAKPATPAAVTPPTQGKPAVVATPTAQVGRANVDARAVIDEKVKGETDAMLAKMVRDECLLLESEVKALLHQGRRVRIDIGGDEEKLAMLQEMEGLREFIKEIVEISLGESAEVHSLKQNLILSWAWYEEAQSRYNISKDETMTLLLKSQPLDSATEKRQSDIQKLIYYMESQLSQTNRALDEQWDRFQDYAKKTHRVEMPTMEAIFQSMVKQNAVLQKQSYILKDLASRLKHKKNIVNGSSLFLTAGNMKKLEDDLKRLQLVPEDTHRAIFESAMDKTRNLTSTKQSKLRNLLKSRSVHVVKPQLNVSSLCSPASRAKQTSSILGAQMSPVQKIPLARNLGFIQSTPIRGLMPDMKPTPAPPNTPARKEPLKVFTFQNSEPTVSTAATSPSIITLDTFTISNLSQSTTPTSHPSIPPAFNPITQTNKIVNAPKTSDKPVTNTFSVPSFPFGSMNSAAGTNKSAIGVSKSQPAVGSKKPEPTLAGTPTCTASTKSIFSFGGTSSESIAAASSGSLFGNLSQTGAPLFGSAGAMPFGTGATTTSNVSSASVAASVGVTKATTGLGVGISTSLSAGKTLTSLNPSVPASAAPLVTQSVTSKPSVATSKTQITATIASTPISAAFSFNSKAAPVTSATNMPTSFFGPATATGASIFAANATNPSISTTTPPITAFVTTTSIGSSIFSTITSSAGSATTVATTTGTSSIFGLTSATTPSATTGSFSIFKSAPVTTSTATTTTGTSSVFFGSTPPTTPTATTGVSSIFVSTPVITSTTTTPAGGFLSFESTTATKTTGTPSIFASTPTATPSIFVSTSNAVTTTGTSPMFGSKSTATSATTTTGSPSIFGSSFASTSTAASTTSSPFVGSTPGTTSTATTTNLFGSTMFGGSATTTASGSIFGSSTPIATVTSSPASIFGSNSTSTSAFGVTPPSTTQAPLFGGTTQGSIFGAPTATTTTPSVFGGAAKTGSIFGGGGVTTQASIFGGASNQPPVFGSTTTTAAATTTTVAAIAFGSTPVVTAASPFGTQIGQSGSLFGAPTATTTAFGGFGGGSVFGSTAGQPPFGASTTSAAAFGGTGASAFGAVSSSGNIFGAPAVSNSFGFGGLNVGSAAGGSIFGQAPANPFAGSADKKPVFGSDGNLFGAAAASTTFGAAFGQQQPAFGQGAFGGPQPGPFSGTGGASGVGQSGFGSPSAFQKPSGFGGSAVFGGSPQPAFGASPSFGGAPAFGAAPAFGSPNKVFGSTTPAAAFGSPAVSSPGFGNLANQNTVGFGNLAQQASNTPASTTFSGNTSFSSWR